MYRGACTRERETLPLPSTTIFTVIVPDRSVFVAACITQLCTPPDCDEIADWISPLSSERDSALLLMSSFCFDGDVSSPRHSSARSAEDSCTSLGGSVSSPPPEFSQSSSSPPGWRGPP